MLSSVHRFQRSDLHFKFYFVIMTKKMQVSKHACKKRSGVLFFCALIANIHFEFLIFLLLNNNIYIITGSESSKTC